MMNKRKHKKVLCPYCQTNKIYSNSKRCRVCYLKMGSHSHFSKGHTPWNKGLHGKENPQWNGGKAKVQDGTKLINYCRKIAEQVLGRKLKSDECVHHINFNITDDKKENLLICYKSCHTTLHNKIRGLKLTNYFKSLPGGVLHQEKEEVEK